MSNDGEKIDSEEQPYLFERFYKGKGGNFGIGLSMAKEIVALQKGEILVESNEEKTTFKISIPQAYF